MHNYQQPHYGMQPQQQMYGMDPLMAQYQEMEPYQHQQNHVIDHSRILNTVQNCANTCDYMVNMLLLENDVRKRAQQIQYLRDCTDMCRFMVSLLARRSAFIGSAAQLCAYICEICGEECLRHKDAESQRCGRICIECARECRSLAMA